MWKKVNILSTISAQNIRQSATLKLAQWFWRRRLLNVVNVLLLLSLDGKSFEQSWTPFTQECFVPSSVEIVRVFFFFED